MGPTSWTISSEGATGPSLKILVCDYKKYSGENCTLHCANSPMGHSARGERDCVFVGGCVGGGDNVCASELAARSIVRTHLCGDGPCQSWEEGKIHTYDEYSGQFTDGFVWTVAVGLKSNIMKIFKIICRQVRPIYSLVSAAGLLFLLMVDHCSFSTTDSNCFYSLFALSVDIKCSSLLCVFYPLP